ncbi:CARDB domain-containing protein [Hymenobacter ruricola]|uniref:Fibronectin type-III domain-containing protein n=1 Tax=Hymenobacter ruricola TaxID=2791023 RepID=A0ABS0HY19_9BACT|nr:CARDB domain-containing protein [Hymenobacter ruricola]MBF9219603.1 hypothetical protein [Hymenobacter ruricola]
METDSLLRQWPWLKALLLLGVLLAGRPARAQSLTRLEYFYDTDPGHGQGTPVSFPTAAAAQDFTYTASLAGLAPGFHTLYTRVREQRPAEVNPLGPLGPLGASADAGQPAYWPARAAWSIAHVRPVYVGPVGTGLDNLTYLEYFFDTDPGYRLGHGVALTAPAPGIDQTYMADLSGLAPGFHTMYTRVKNASGAWSISHVQPIYVGPASGGGAASSLTYAEYYLDTDPGYGQGTRVNFATPGPSIDQDFVADLSGVANGIHTLFVRVRNAAGAWSLVNVKPFLRQGSIAGGTRPLITRVRYQVFPESSATPSAPPEYYVLPAPARAADVDVTFPTNVCVSAAGNYVMRVAVLDANGVPAIEYAHPFSVSTPSQLSPNLPPALAGCSGQPLTITSASAGVGGSYQWSLDGSPLPGETSQSLTVTTAGTYSVALTSALGCTGTGSSTVTFAPAPTIALAPVTDVPCGQTSVTLDAGAGYASYAWSPGGQTTQTITASAPGTYSVTVTGASTGTCTATASTTVRMPRADIVQTNATQCPGQSTTLSLAAPVDGTVTWSASDNSVTSSAASITVAPTATTTYTATVSDGSFSCSDAVTINIPPALPLSLPDTTRATCGTASVTLDAGSGGTSYLWSTGATSQTISVSAPGLYSVTVDNGCPKSDQTYVLLPNATIAQSSQSICSGSSITLSLNAPVNGSIVWMPGGQTTPSITVAPTATTTYTATVRDHGQNCSASVTISVDAPLALSLPADSSPACGTASVTLDAGPASSYLWSTGATSRTISVSSPGTYSVTGAHGACTSTASTQVFMPYASIAGGAIQHVCAGQPLTLSLAAPVNGTVLWSTGATGNSITVTPSADASYSVTVSAGGHDCSATVSVVVDLLPVVTLAAQAAVCASADTYTLTGGLPAGGTYSGPGVSGNSFSPSAAGPGTHTITYSYTNGNNCTATATQALTVNPLPMVTLVAQPTKCLGAAAFALTGGAPAGGSYSGPGVSGGQFSPTAVGPGTYTISYRYIDGNGCANTATQPLTVLPRPILAVTPDSVLCPGSSATLAVSNAGPGATYAWSTGATGSSIAVNAPATVGAPATYSVTVTNAAGCSYSFTQKVYRSPASVAPLAVTNMLPVDNSAGLDLPINFGWNPGAGSTASSFDLYIWPSSGSQPATPTVAGISTLQTSYGGAPLAYGQSFKWRVVARNVCGSTPGPVQTFELRQLPDLTVPFVQAADTAYVGQTVAVSWNVTNSGVASTLAQQWQDGVYFSQNPTFDNTAMYMGSVGNVTYLQPNGTYISQGTFPVPLSMAGYYYVYVKANSNGALLETSYANNVGREASGPAPALGRVLIIVPTAPDLVVQTVSHFTSFFGGDTAAVGYRVRNTGSVDVVNASWTDAGYFSPDTTQNIAQNTGQGLLGPTARRGGTTRHAGQTLNVNAAYNDNLRIPIPHTTPTGDYYLYVFTDDNNEVFETASTNNVNPRTLVHYNTPTPHDHLEYVPVHVTLRPPPDLVITSVTAPAAATAGTSLPVSWVGRNAGLSRPYPRLETYWADNVYLSLSPTFDNTAISLGQVFHYEAATGLQPNATYAAAGALNLPNGISGNYYVYVQADAGNNVFEYTHEDNNVTRSAGTVAINLVYADLYPTALTAPASVSAPNSFVVNYTVQNTNTAVIAAGGTWTDHLTVSDAAGHSAVLASVPHAGPLAAGASYSNSATISLPNNFVPGTLTVRLTADAGNRVYEFNYESNNEQTTTLTYLYSDDLAVQNLTATPAPAASGNGLNVAWRVRNLGSFQTLATAWTDQAYLSLDNVIDGSDLLLAAPGSTAGPLAPSGFYQQSQTVTLPQGISGSYYVLLRTANNPNGTLADTNPANNVAALALPITLTPPADLQIVTTGGNGPGVPTAALAGQQVSLSFRVQNDGVGATPAASWNDGIYLSPSPTLAGATRIGVVPHTGALAAGDFYNVTTNVTIPGYLAGNYYLFIATDNNDPSGYGPQFAHWGGAVQVGQVYEHQHEFNNVWQAPTTVNVTVPQPSDLVVTMVAVPGTAKLGKTMTVSYSVRNQGSNAAVGQLKDGLYLSSDRVLSTGSDKLFGTSTRNLTIAAGATVSGVIRDRVQGLSPGDYHGILGTNLFRDVFESDYQNDTLSQAAPTNVTVNVLPLNTLTLFALDRDSLEFYKVTPGAGFDLRLALGSNQNHGQNEIYVAYNRVPTTSDFDFIYEDPINTRQELLIPSTGGGDYYILVKTPYVYAGTQTATLFAEALPFQVRSIASDTVGQGRVTTRVLGAGFVRRTGNSAALAGTKFYITKGSSPTPLAYADIVRFRSSVEVTLRWHFDRDSVDTGTYNVVAEQANGTKVQLTNGLTVEPSSGLLVNFASITPPRLRVGTRGNWTYFLTNSSNVDVPYWEFQFAVPPGAGVVETHTPNVRKKSDFAPAVPLSNSANNGYVSNATEVFPFIAQDLRPGEIIQVNLNMLPPIDFNSLQAAGGRVHFPVVLNQQPKTAQDYSRRTLDFIAKYKAAVLANPGQFDPAVVALANNPGPTVWRDSLQRQFVRLGLIDTAWTVPAHSPKALPYTHKNSQTQVPGGVGSDYWHIEEQYHEFRPDFFALGYPLALRPAADSVRFLFNSRGATSTEIIASVDPNLIAGPAGYGPRRMVGVQQKLNYQVQFENDSLQATGPAQRVRVQVPLDVTTNLQTFRLGDFGFNGTTYAVPANASTYAQTLHLSPLPYDVRVVAGVDVSSRLAFWYFQTIDRATGLPPTDSLIGFLGISDTLGQGHGFVNYTIQPGGTALTGDSLVAQGSIVFDSNTPLKTNRWGNIVDAAAPVSHVNAVAASQLSPTVHLTWTGSDDVGGSGVRSYEVFASEDGGPFVRVAQDVTGTSYDFPGLPGARYDFFTLATDHTDNREKLKLTGDTFTVIEDTALVVYDLVHNQCLLSDPITSTGSGTWQRLKLNGKTVAALNDQGHALGTVRVEFAVMSGGSVRQDGRGTKYLDRNWHIITETPLGTGNAAQVRFYGLTAEFNKLKVADPTNVSSLNSLRLTQYSGPNEDCDLANNLAAGSTTVLLTPQMSDPVGVPYFVAQATVTDHFSEFYVNGGNRPLPVELTSFTAVRRGRDVLAEWATASERNSAYFALEASAAPRDGFREIGRVAAAGSSAAPRRYTATEPNVPMTGGLRYYRLRQVDLDGTTSYGPVRAVRLDEVNGLALRAAPNPFRQQELVATITTAEAGTGHLQLLDLAGRALFQRELALPMGETTVPLPELVALPPGVYVLTLRVGREVRQQKLLKE